MQGTLAIDLGSSSTVVAFQAPGEPARLLNIDPYSLDDPCVVPSLLWLSSADAPKPLLGRQVLEAGLAFAEGPELQRDFKRLIGAEPWAAGRNTDLPLSPEAAGELLLLQLWQALPADISPQRLVLTAPIDTYGGYRRWLLQLAQRLAVAEIALLDEPTAAAIGCGLPPGSTVLVIDLGGGTTDLSLVQLAGGEGRAAPIAQLLRLGGRLLDGSCQSLRTAKVLAKAGLAIGGRDIDRWIAAHLCPNEPLAGSLLAQTEQLKCQLSQAPVARTLWCPPSRPPIDLQLDHDTLDAVLQRHGLISQLDALLESVLAQARAAGVAIDQIDAVLPVGGTSRLGAIQHWLMQRFDAVPVPVRSQRPIEAVALGALALTPGVQLRDVLSQGVSLRCWDRRSGQHHWHPLYVPGQSWPTEQPLELRLACSRDGQDAIELVLGEPADRQRGEVIFENGLPVLRNRAAGPPQVTPWPQQPPPLVVDPPGRQGEDRLLLRFGIDTDAQLCLEVQDLAHCDRPATVQRLGPVR